MREICKIVNVKFRKNTSSSFVNGLRMINRTKFVEFLHALILQKGSGSTTKSGQFTAGEMGKDHFSEETEGIWQMRELKERFSLQTE